LLAEGIGLVIEQTIARIREQKSHRWAWKNYPATVRDLVSASRSQSVIEIGGGRFPFFSAEDVATLGLSYTTNDISARELAKAPAWTGKALFDVQTADRDAVAPFAESFDFAFSKMVMEHVASYKRAYANIHTILKPGGVSVAFHPTLYALPFVMNKLLPETLAEPILQAFFPTRNDDGIPKFPARYNGCVISNGVQSYLRGIGFRDVWQIPFYGHDYYIGVPLLRSAQASLSRFAARGNLTGLASYAYTIVRK
jgi:SAM-dependent methyltransferase